MLNKKYLGIFLIGFGAVTGSLTILIQFINRGQGGGYLALLLMAVGCVVAGSVVAFTQVLDRYAQPLVDEIGSVIQDDLEDIKARRFTTAQLMVVVTVVLSLVFLFFVFRLQKLAATWDGFPVAVPTVVLVGLVTWIVTRSAWFKNQKLATARRIFFVPVIGLILSMLLGIPLMEETQLADWDVATGGQVSPMKASEGNGFTVDGGMDMDFSIFDLMECDDEACEVLFLVIGLIVLTLVMVIGSAFIPHFWFLSGSVLLTVLLLMTVHEIRLRPTAEKKEAEESPG